MFCKKLVTFLVNDYFTKCLRNESCDVMKIREMKGEVGKKPPKKEMNNPSFLWRHMDHFWHNFKTIWALSQRRKYKHSRIPSKKTEGNFLAGKRVSTTGAIYLDYTSILISLYFSFAEIRFNGFFILVLFSTNFIHIYI